MNLLYISVFLFQKKDDLVYALPSCSDFFFQKYLDIFENIKVLGAPLKSYLDPKSLVQIQDDRISVEILPPNTSPRDFINDRKVRICLEKEISAADAVLVRPLSRRGLMAIKIAEKMNKPYMIEMTGDIHNALRQHPNLLKRMYAPFLYRQIKNTIKKCQYGLYVSQKYLQERYPIAGEMCGCSDVVLEKSDESVFEKRIRKIEQLGCQKIINIALIGFYQGKMKGVDTAIRAMSHLPEKFHLSILGNGTQASRDMWYEYAAKYGVKSDRIHFPTPLPSSKLVLQWLDTMDFFVLPTRSEGLCRCIVEAMSRGCICFASRVCTNPELLSKECLFELDDDKKIAKLLLSYTSDVEKMKMVAQRNFEEAKRFDVDLLREKRNAFLKKFEHYCEQQKET